MDRRNFIKLVGGTATLPLIPFRGLERGRRRSDPPGPTPPGYAYRLLLNGIDYSQACTGISYRRDAIDITTLGDLPGRRFMPGTAYLNIGLLTAIDIRPSECTEIEIHFQSRDILKTKGWLSDSTVGWSHDRIETNLCFTLEGGIDE